MMSFQVASVDAACEIEATSCPVASFATQNNGCTGPCAISFVNQSVDAVTYHWEFGDGTTSSSENPSHTYEEAGTYTVTLRAIGIGCQHEFIGTVDVIAF